MKISFDFKWFKNEEMCLLSVDFMRKVDNDFFTLFSIHILKFIFGIYLTKG
jgi:hypothetical protein